MISFLAKAFDNDVHDLRDHGWEPLEDLVDNAMSNLLKLGVRVLDELKCWISQLLKLRRD
jgi:hypothetical protein